MQLSLFTSLLILLTISIVINAICQRIKIPVIIGYILVGVLVGPHAVGIVSESESIKLLAEFGIVFLMFTVGLEFSLTQLIKLKKDVFGYGALQVLLTIIVTVLIGLAVNMTMAQSLIVGFIIAMSSTAIVLKLLTETLEINSPYSQHALGILLFQDLAVIPILILLPNMSEINPYSFINILLFSIFKGLVAIVLILFIGKRVLRPLFYSMTSAYSLEMFTLTILFITLGSAWLTSYFGLSLALGAFLAGMMLGETEFRHQIKTDIRPFRDVLLGIFFITIGMQFDTKTVLTAWSWMLLLFLALIIFKFILISVLGRFFTQSKIIATQTGLILSQGGEFGFAILIYALSHHLLPEDYGQVIIGSLLLSMIVSPFIIKYNQNIISILYRKSLLPDTKEQISLNQATSSLSNHIILCGYGRVGQNIARFLERAKLEFLALDLDPVRVKNAQLAGENVCYAEATDYEILKLAKINHAKAVIISFSNTHAAINIIEQVRKHHKHLPIIVRCHDDSETKIFYEKGATEVIPEILEASLMIASHILLLMNIPPKKVYAWVDESRHHRYDLLRMVFPGQESPTLEVEETKEVLNVVILSKGSYAINRTLNELSLHSINVKITAIRRKSQRLIDPPPTTILHEDDIIVLYGSQPNLEHAEKLLLIGE